MNKNYFEFSIEATGAVYDARALIECARNRLDAFDGHDKSDEIIDADRALRMAAKLLTDLATSIDANTVTFGRNAQPTGNAGNGAH